MIINKLAVLVYQERLLGLRAYTDKGIFDTEIEALRSLGIYNINIKDRIELIFQDGLLVTEEEKGLLIKDISQNEELLEELKNAIGSSEYKEELFRLQSPYEQTLAVFIGDTGWEAIKVDRNDEYKNQHNLLKPDGSYWKGGWIGSARTPEIAKINFHRNEVKFALHRAESVPDEVLVDYPDLKKVNDVIKYFTSLLRLDKETMSVRILDEDNIKTFSVYDYPEYRIDQRAFITVNNLVPREVIQYNIEESIFDKREIFILAINRVLNLNTRKVLV